MSRSQILEHNSQEQVDPLTTEHRVPIEGVQVRYLEAGSGPDLLLLHGHEQSATGWRWVTSDLAKTHRVLALTLPGPGSTDPADGAHLQGEDVAAFISAFLDKIDVASVDVVAHSAGGIGAIRLALAEPHRVRTLTLVDSAGLGREVHPLLAMDTLPVLGEVAVLLSRFPGGGFGRSFMSTAMLFAKPWRVPAEFFSEQRDVGNRRGQLESSTAMARLLFDATGQRQILLDRLPELNMPTLLIWGALDCVLPVHHAYQALQRLSQGYLEIVADCGHLPHVERPEQFTAALHGFLTEHSAAPEPSATPDEPAASPARPRRATR